MEILEIAGIVITVILLILGHMWIEQSLNEIEGTRRSIKHREKIRTIEDQYHE